MSAERVGLDANILFYTVDADAGELQQKAREIVRCGAHDEDLQHERELEGVRFRNPFLVDDPFVVS